MRASRAEMDKSHQRIVENASRLMRQNGIETTSVNDVMTAAGLTHGGFYRHFESKDALVKAALEAAFTEALQTIEETWTMEGSKDYFFHYLSQGHVSHPELGCPVSALGVDVSRAAPAVKETFTEGFNRVIDRLAESGKGTFEENRQAALVQFATLAGAVLIARATEPEAGQEVLSACRQALAKGECSSPEVIRHQSNPHLRKSQGPKSDSLRRKTPPSPAPSDK